VIVAAAMAGLSGAAIVFLAALGILVDAAAAFRNVVEARLRFGS
jgi:hypothetical protein